MFENLKGRLKSETNANETQDEKGKKKKIENLIFLIILLIITVIIINMVWGNDNGEGEEQSDKV